VETARQGYQELLLSRLGLKRMYGISLTMALTLALFSALSLAFLISERLAAPLRALARGTRAVARGDFTQVHTVASRDELGMLTQSFNRMTRQLADARAAALGQPRQVAGSQRLSGRRAVQASRPASSRWNTTLTVRLANPAVSAILDLPRGELEGRNLADGARRTAACASSPRKSRATSPPPRPSPGASNWNCHAAPAAASCWCGAPRCRRAITRLRPGAG
jgi:nitrogen fixation/metabolism regulation signal transduction histidine kinase